VLILLPPSETKRDGGIPGSALDLAALSFPSLGSARRTALAELRKISSSIPVATRALGLGPKQRFEVDRNRAVRSSPVMPAIERYTGVLYDAIDVSTLDAGARDFLGGHVVIHSALFGLIGADDLIPAYRFSHDTRLAGISLPKLWRDANAAVLAGTALAEPAELILDLRSESYVHLGPAPVGSHFLRVVTPGPDGTVRALNHFNKHGKGEFVRALAQAGRDFETVDELLEWAQEASVELRLSEDSPLQLVV
jgi:cytoplasmic iron level regulating protein YaaA (DUF328/UPF0246 family)